MPDYLCSGHLPMADEVASFSLRVLGAAAVEIRIYADGRRVTLPVPRIAGYEIERRFRGKALQRTGNNRQRSV